MSADNTLAFILVAALAALMVGLAKGGLPMVGLLSVPLLSLIAPPVTATALIAPLYVISDIVGLIIYARSFDGRNLLILIPSGIFGIFIGWMSVAYISPALIQLMIGLMGLAFCGHYVFKHEENRSAVIAPIGPGLFLGSLAGLASFFSHAGSPPFQIYALPQKLPKMVFAGTSTIVFACLNMVKLPAYWSLGQLNFSSLLQTLWMIPIAIAGTLMGYFMTRRLPERLFFRLIVAALAVLSSILIYEACNRLYAGA